MKKHRGFTLVEMLVVIAISSLVLTSVGVALHSLARTDRLLRGEVLHALTRTRLSAQLRADAHQAASAEKAGDGRVLFESDTRNTVEYASESQHLLRVVRQGNEVRHRERYRLPEKANVRWEVRSVPGPAFVVLEITWPGGSIASAEDARRVDRIEAALGLEQEYTNLRR